MSDVDFLTKLQSYGDFTPQTRVIVGGSFNLTWPKESAWDQIGEDNEVPDEYIDVHEELEDYADKLDENEAAQNSDMSEMPSAPEYFGGLFNMQLEDIRDECVDGGNDNTLWYEAYRNAAIELTQDRNEDDSHDYRGGVDKEEKIQEARLTVESATLLFEIGAFVGGLDVENAKKLFEISESAKIKPKKIKFTKEKMLTKGRREDPTAFYYVAASL